MGNKVSLLQELQNCEDECTREIRTLEARIERNQQMIVVSDQMERAHRRGGGSGERRKLAYEILDWREDLKEWKRKQTENRTKLDTLKIAHSAKEEDRRNKRFASELKKLNKQLGSGQKLEERSSVIQKSTSQIETKVEVIRESNVVMDIANHDESVSHEDIQHKHQNRKKDEVDLLLETILDHADEQRMDHILASAPLAPMQPPRGGGYQPLHVS